MLRILHSLPRTHKFLLLPVATMVTVLGAEKIVSSLQDAQREVQSPDSVFVPLAPNARPGLPSLDLDRSPVADAIEIASQALDATREHVPLSRLTPTEVVELSFIESASAGGEAGLPAATDEPTFAAAAGEQAAIEDGTLHMAIIVGTISSGMLDQDTQDVAAATSYEDVSEQELDLFADGPIILEEEIASSDAFVPEWQSYEVKQGDIFAILAQNRLGLGYREVLNLLEATDDPRILTHWHAGNHFEYQLDEQGKLLTLRMMNNARSGLLIEREQDAFKVASIERSGEPTQRLFAGTVSGSFARSAQSTGLNSTEVAELANVLEKKLDFRRDTRRGDRFQVLIESDIIDGETLDSRVLAIQYEGDRMDLTVVRNAEDNHFYTPDGQSLDPAFSRYPFEGRYRLSSNFNPNRKHPVTGRVSPHKGTDFAMPIGSPVQAPANGRVEKVGNHPLAGRYLVVRHDNGYKTRYLHLSKSLVKRGERVEMNQRIALSGNTGRSTGPHLHYEVLVNNSQVDAMKVALPESQSLEGERLMAFKGEVEPILAVLESGETGTVVASARSAEDDDG
ncbi:peptidoglycan DD-metalloendopeptidase family protein [Halomonas sp. TRM85114]|uniref:peptidoglycan DD-metalloendopeptidase family protein n=1 Tax=Halomonas jincaotanensis TaxID=2810616 RepID=UPI001BD67B00|nr:peptidoglycan DD-metalloendopeptidase family protein [Halomonas jincaotanensis]MBS9402984.1 peptidoglycan DD-metalloendopeptidase family protein [Halomonas jincaotanensis]